MGMGAFLNLQTYLTILLGSTAIAGDFLVERTKNKVQKAIFDNATHATIGGLSWFLLAFSLKKSNTKSYHNFSDTLLFDTFLCTLISSFIDLDHFVAARSLQLKVRCLFASKVC